MLLIDCMHVSMIRVCCAEDKIYLKILQNKHLGCYFLIQMTDIPSLITWWSRCHKAICSTDNKEKMHTLVSTLTGCVWGATLFRVHHCGLLRRDEQRQLLGVPGSREWEATRWWEVKGEPMNIWAKVAACVWAHSVSALGNHGRSCKTQGTAQASCSTDQMRGRLLSFWLNEQMRWS